MTHNSAFEEVATGVVVYRHAWADGTCALVLGDPAQPSASAVAIDGGGDPADGEAMAEFLRGRGHQPTRLIYTHGHSDHVWGAQALGLGEVIAHELTPGVMRRQVPSWAQRWQVDDAAAAARVAWPTLTFSDEMRVHLDERRTLRLLRTPGHSPDGISVLVEDCRVLIAGDCAATGIVPALGDGDGRTLEASLRLLADMDIAVLVPGHGPVVRDTEVATWLRWGADYLLGVRRRVRQLLASGTPVEQIGDKVSYAEFVGDRLPPDRHGMPNRHAAAVTKIIDEERTRMPRPPRAAE
jgi:cyclase